MPRKRRNRGRGRARNSGAALIQYEFEGLYNVASGAGGRNTKTITYGALQVDFGRPLKLVSASFSVVLTNSSAANIQCAIYGAEVTAETLSRIGAVSSTTQRFFLRAPSVQDYFTPTSQTPAASISVFSSQPGPSETNTVHVIYSGSITLAVQRRDQAVNIK